MLREWEAKIATKSPANTAPTSRVEDEVDATQSPSNDEVETAIDSAVEEQYHGKAIPPKILISSDLYTEQTTSTAQQMIAEVGLTEKSGHSNRSSDIPFSRKKKVESNVEAEADVRSFSEQLKQT